MITSFFLDAVKGEIKDEKRIFSRKEFFDEIERNALAKYIWCFNQGGKTYIFGKDSENENQQAIKMLISEDLEERRLNYIAFISLVEKMNPASIHKLSRASDIFQRLKRVHDLESLKNKGFLEKVEVKNISYEDFIPEEGDVIYCDIPYEIENKGKCNQYNDDSFDNLKFYEWAKNQKEQIFFSSYEISDQSFFKMKIRDLSAFGRLKRNEYIYSNKPIIPNQKN